jgi:3-oxoacyl-[acyl-carrier protein] reductase
MFETSIREEKIMKLDSAVCIVSGSAVGVGAASAIQLAGKGAKVVVNYSKSEKEARETLAQCHAAGGEAILVQGDVAVDADCRRIAQAALDKWGRIDALINNAAITKFVDQRDLEGLSADDFQHLYAVNVIGPYQMTRACTPALQKQGGAVVMISSMSGITGVGSSNAYVATKGALNTLTLALARALAPSVRVNAVCPGFIETRWHHARFGSAGEYQQYRDKVVDNVTLAKVCKAEDVAELAVWLVEHGDLMTGETLKLDGGSHLGVPWRKR